MRNEKTVEGAIRRGGGNPWTTPEQASWLQSKIPGYRQAQARGEVRTFLAQQNEQFLGEWPLGADQANDSTTNETNDAERLEKRKRVSRNLYSQGNITYIY